MESIQLLKSLISIDSVFPNERKLAEHIENVLKELGFTVRRISVGDNRFNVVGERGSIGKSIGFYGHLDTVPAYGKWLKSPTTSWEDGDRLYGLGSSDMKAGVAAILMACNLSTKQRIKVAFGVDEENISEGAFAILNDGFFNDCEGVVVTELGESNRESLGSKMITLGRRGHVVYEVHVPGRSAHGAHVPLGINSIDEASRFVLKLRDMRLPNDNRFPPATQFVCKFHSENTSLSIPDNAVLEIDRHTIPPETAESVLADLQNQVIKLYELGEFREIDGNKITVNIKPRKTPYLDPYGTSKEHPFVKKLAHAVKSYHKVDPLYTYGASVADENVFAKSGLPVVTIGAIGGNEHSANEWVSKKSYLELIDVLKTFLSS